MHTNYVLLTTTISEQYIITKDGLGVVSFIPMDNAKNTQS